MSLRTAPELPEAIDRYEILDRLASGGMAEVFLGRMKGELAFERFVALKRILPPLAAGQRFIEMFVDEAHISSRLHHSNIAQVLDFGRTEETYFLALEYVPGIDLREVYLHPAGDEAMLPAPIAACILSGVCAALEYAHSRRDDEDRPMRIVHRDVSPSNVLISFEGEVKLIDFGIARAAERLHQTTGGSLKGKYAYMSPEQVSGQEIDHRSDIFGVGILLYELLTGRSPFVRSGDRDIEVLERIHEARVSPPSTQAAGVPPALEAICLRALGRYPEDRYQSAGELQQELEAFCHETGHGAWQLRSWVQSTFAEQMQKKEELFRQLRRSTQRAPSLLLHGAKTRLLDRRAEALPPGVPAAVAGDMRATEVECPAAGEPRQMGEQDTTTRIVPARRRSPLGFLVAAALLGLAGLAGGLMLGRGTGRPAGTPARDGAALPAPAGRRAAEATRHYILVKTGEAEAECRMRVGELELQAQLSPCTFKLAAGQEARLRVVQEGEERYSERWRVQGDREIRLALTRPARPDMGRPDGPESVQVRFQPESKVRPGARRAGPARPRRTGRPGARPGKKGRLSESLGW